VLKTKSCVEDKKLCSKQKVVLKIKSCDENKKLIFGGDGTP
jgi:hypothetical protein